VISDHWRPPLGDSEPVSLWRQIGERLYGLGLDLNSRRGSRAEAIRGAAVLSVGNLEAGGTGKTPCVLWWARRLREAGRTTVVCRPYGPAAGGEASDEIAEFRERLPGEVGLELDSRKLTAARKAASDGAKFIVVDDGFSHRALARDLDLILLDARRPLGNGRLLPAGTLRERPAAMVRADAVVLSRADRATGEQIERSRKQLQGLGFTGPILTARHRCSGIVEAGELRPPAGERVFCASGLGRPTELAEAAHGAGLTVVGERSFGDHHRFAPREWQEIRKAAGAESARLLMTRKDAVRLPTEWRREVVILETEWEWLAGDVEPSWLVEKLVRASER
jgi:tetraacyldisaccharide 4'-kinase